MRGLALILDLCAIVWAVVTLIIAVGLWGQHRFVWDMLAPYAVLTFTVLALMSVARIVRIEE